jgi:hypothetical protein
MTDQPTNTDVYVCQWFALCTNLTDQCVSHPVLGDVPTCERCAAKLGLNRRLPFEGEAS